jgi:bifunctional polynucleotide phosphatase/kinase
LIDNTNPEPATRKLYISIAEDQGIPIRCFVFQTDPDLAYHLNFYREVIEGTRRVPDVGYNQFKSKFKGMYIDTKVPNNSIEPSTSEGFSEIKKINWIPDFPTEDHKKKFLERMA